MSEAAGSPQEWIRVFCELEKSREVVVHCPVCHHGKVEVIEIPYPGKPDVVGSVVLHCRACGANQDFRLGPESSFGKS